MAVAFTPSPRPTVGVEWELALVDRTSRDLVNAADAVLAGVRSAGSLAPGRVTGELLRNTVEVVSGVCENADAVAADLGEAVAAVRAAAEPLGVELACAGTHPFGQWSTDQLADGERYAELIERTQWWGRQMLIWGLHVHVGLDSADKVFPVLGALLHKAPHLQALTASSPFWTGVDTGYASNRAMMFQQLPTAGLPFAFERWEEYEGFVDDQLRTGVIDGLSDVRWDIRPAPHLGTLEVRVCDGVPTLAELRAVTALVHCLVVDLDRRLVAGERLPSMPPWHVQENKWRAARYGLDAEVVLDAAGRERLVTDDLADLLEDLQPVARDLGCVDALGAVEQITRTGASYQRQRAVAERSGGDLVAVVDALVGELRTGEPASA
ncbi:glutamate--cysteine ligase [uncultured Pseudokineococcus sp.]|uniref:glutamate--cysteine ligase n=1 Tax=uncultured Pseudokineococcus sp. TaxID=1642928 RepID=UPI002638487D|nr:glutamate--cysteine ligase [uncultured Pseudokineococcus sp.]